MKNDSKGVHTLCSTRWTVRGESLESILNNFDELMELWDWSLENLRDTQMKARIGSVKAAMPTFDHPYSSLLAIMFLKQTDNLSRTLQDPKVSAAEGNETAQDVIKCISKDRYEESFNLFWEYSLKKKDQLHKFTSIALSFHENEEYPEDMTMATVMTISFHQRRRIITAKFTLKPSTR